MRTGAYGGPTRRTYGVLGDDVNMAARLMSTAELGQILGQPADRRCGRAPVHAALCWRDQRQRQAGRRCRSRWCSTGARLRPSARPRCSPARWWRARASWRSITQLLEAAQASAGQILRLEGAAGVGKSHLAAEIVERAVGWGMRTAIGMCQSTTESTAYAPWRQICAG